MGKTVKKSKVKGKGRGKKYSEKQKSTVREMLAMGYSIREISEKVKIPESTIRSWKTAILSETPEELAKVRAEKRVELAGAVWDNAVNANKLLTMRLERALKLEDGLDAIIGIVMTATEDELDPETRRNILKSLQAMRFDRPTDIAQVFGVAVDKHYKLVGDEKTQVELSGSVCAKLEDV